MSLLGLTELIFITGQRVPFDRIALPLPNMRVSQSDITFINCHNAKIFQMVPIHKNNTTPLHRPLNNYPSIIPATGMNSPMLFLCSVLTKLLLYFPLNINGFNEPDLLRIEVDKICLGIAQSHLPIRKLSIFFNNVSVMEPGHFIIQIGD